MFVRRGLPGDYNAISRTSSLRSVVIVFDPKYFSVGDTSLVEMYVVVFFFQF